MKAKFWEVIDDFWKHAEALIPARTRSDEEKYLLKAEAAFSCFNHYRKLLLRHEKLEHSFRALNHLTAAIIGLRKMLFVVNIIYG